MTRIFRIVVPVSDMAKADRFYQTVLDASVDEVAPTRHYIDAGGVILALVDPSEHGGAFRPNPDHVYFAVSDLEGTRRRVDAADAREVSLDPSQHGANGIAMRPWGERPF